MQLTKRSSLTPTTPTFVKCSAKVYGNVKAHAATASADVKSESHVRVEAVQSEPFTGGYLYVPSEDVQVVDIKGKSARQDIVIEPIPSNYGRIEYDGSSLSVI